MICPNSHHNFTNLTINYLRSYHDYEARVLVILFLVHKTGLAVLIGANLGFH